MATVSWKRHGRRDTFYKKGAAKVVQQSNGLKFLQIVSFQVALIAEKIHVVLTLGYHFYGLSELHVIFIAVLAFRVQISKQLQLMEGGQHLRKDVLMKRKKISKMMMRHLRILQITMQEYVNMKFPLFVHKQRYLCCCTVQLVHHYNLTSF